MHTHSRNNKRWTESEDDYIRNNYTRMLVSDIAEQLGRSSKATRTRIERLGIGLANLKRNSKRNWTEHEIRILIENKTLPIKEFSHLLPSRGHSAIYAKSILIGIKRKEKKGYYFDGGGRKQIYIKHGVSVAEHRYVVETELHRKLSRFEQVHHINCNKTDNRIENLFVFSNVSRHLISHRSIEKLVEVLMEKGIIKFDRSTGEYAI